MESLMALTGMTVTMGLSLWLALALGWLCLRGAFHLMPANGARAARRLRVIPGAPRQPQARWAPAQIVVQTGARGKGLPRAL